MANFRSTRVSAPGKVLLAGGYIVLDEAYSGLVLSTTARFYSIVTAQPLKGEDDCPTTSGEWHQLFPFVINCHQFNQLIDGWIEENCEGRYRFRIRESSHRNSFVEETVLCVINSIAGLESFREKNTFQLLVEARMGVHVTLQGDNDYYSQVKRLQDAKLPFRRASLKTLAPFLSPRMEERDGKLVAIKTGLGSSAALVTSLVAALLDFFVPAFDFNNQEKDLELVHNIAQLSHCFVQRKIGSGFDVSAACFSTQRYIRFPASIMSTFSTEDTLKPEHISRCILDLSKWSISSRVKPSRLPSTFHLMLGDVSSGSETVSMVSHVMKWQKEQPELSKRMMDEMHRHTLNIEHSFTEICELENSFPIDWKSIASQSHEQWNTTDSKVGDLLLRLRKSFSSLRELMREMGIHAGVPIEPSEQTAILDATMEIPGVLFAGVPGAGGYDAICAVIIHEHAFQAVEDLWVRWSIAHPDSIICPLLCDIDRGLEGAKTRSIGLRTHCAEQFLK